jgi:hypothetical protein
MKAIVSSLFFILIIFTNTTAGAHIGLSITGTVFDKSNHPLKDATVFISGSEKITTTNDQGRFIFHTVDPGTFQLSVTHLGYSYYSQNVIVDKTSVNVDVVLSIRPIALNEVVIGSVNDWWANYKIFRRAFLGTSKNATDCEIINPKILSFTNKKKTLSADADDFLIIENKRLGYRIRYMLKDFQYDASTAIALYDGETSFEQLDGTEAEKQEWAKNRLETYKGSLMHFLRSVYQKNTLAEGFLTCQLFDRTVDRVGIDNITWVYIDTRPVKFDTLTTVIDTSFIALKFTDLYVVYDPKRTATTKLNQAYATRKTIQLTDKASTIALYLKDAVIDKKGNHSNYRDFFLEGTWGEMRVADQLPFEYQPPK